MGGVEIIQYITCNPSSVRTSFGLPVITSPSNNIEQEELLLLADEYRPTCAISMTNPGSLTMGFVGADPRQPFLQAC